MTKDQLLEFNYSKRLLNIHFPKLTEIFYLLNNGKSFTHNHNYKLKETHKKLLKRLKINESQVDHWVDKIQIISAVKKAINDYLFESVPYPTYGDGDIVVKTEIFFKHYI